MNDNKDQKPGGGRRRRRRIGLWSLLSIFVLMLVGAMYLMSLVGTQVVAPDWLRQKIVERINGEGNDFRIGFGDVAVIMDDDWVPRLLLRNVVLSNKSGVPIINLSDIESSVALRPLLKGQLQPASIRLTGVRVTLRRSAGGSVNLSVGEKNPALDEAANLAALIDNMEEFLLRPQFAELDQVEIENLSVRYEDARANRAWTVDGGRLAMTRAGDDLQIRGDFALLGARDYATTLEMNYSGRIGSPAAEFGISFEDMPAGDIAGQSPALAWLGALDAPISGALRGAVDEDGALGPLNATLQIGIGVLQPTEATKPIPFTSVRSYFSYDPNTQSMQLDELSLVSKWVSARAEGQAFLVGIENGFPRELLGQIRVTEIKTNPDGLYPQPIEIEAANMDVRLQFDPFVLSLGEMSFSDQGNRFVLNGELQAEAEGWNLALNGHMDALTPKRLLELWPENLKENTRGWIEKNVRKANLKNIQIAVRSRPKHRPDIFLGFDFDGLETQFMKDVPLIEAGSGHASLYDARFVITADSGYVTAAEGGRIDITGTSFIIPDVRINRGPARARLRTSSTITAALSLLDEKPFRFLQKAGQPVTLADGRAEISGQLDLLLKRKLQIKDVAFEISGKLSSVRSETLVPDRVLTAPELKVSATNRSLQIGGEGRIGVVPVRGEWQTDLGPDTGGISRLKGWVELSERFVDEFGIGLPPGSISGAGGADITIDFAKDHPARFELVSDLAGVGLGLRQLGWSMSQAATGSLSVLGTLGAPPVIESISLDAGGLRTQGSVRLKPDGQLDRASFSTVQVGTWLNAPVDLIGRGPGAAPAIEVRGGTIDLRQTSLGGDGSGNSQQKNGGPVSLVLDSLQISDGIALTNFRAELDMSRGVDGSFSGNVNGGAPITGQVVPQGGRSAFRIKSNNAGRVMASAGLLKQARDGKMDLILTPAPEIGSYKGRLEIEGFRIKDAPALAALLNAISVIGILEQLGGDGLHFAKVEADFVLQPDRVTLLAGSAVGPSLGISMDGYYFLESGRMDMQGVFSPLYLVNAIGGIFTRRGEGLIGFNYKIKGSASSPKVTVNPLSALTPGMFREIFRKKPPEVRYNTTDQGLATTPAQGQQAPFPDEIPQDKPGKKPDVSR